MYVLSTKEKIEAVKEVVILGHSVQEVSQNYKCTRQALYLWIKKYKADPAKSSQNLKNRYKSGKNHPKSCSWKQEKMIMDLVIKYPQLSVHGIKKNLDEVGVKFSLHGIENILVRHDLQRAELRRSFSKSQAVKSVFAHELAPAYRAKIVEEYLEEAKPIAQICRKWKISRVTFYDWLKRYKEGQEVTEIQSGGEINIIEALVRRYKKGEDHHKTVPADIKEAILTAVRENPTYSVHKIFATLPKTDGRSIAGHHAVQNVLFREALNTLPKRLEWAGEFAPEPRVSPIELYETPVPKLTVWRLLYAPFKTVPKWVFKHPVSWPVIFPVTILSAWIIEVDKLFNPVFFFPFVALTFGMFFFLYSLKYYFSLIMVMKVAQGGDGAKKPRFESEGQSQTFGMRIKNVLTKSIRVSQPISKSNPLALNFSKVELLSLPFVSIHAPIFNEKRVVERLIKACSSQNWFDETNGKANFEVVVIDDSKDTTTEIVKQKLSEDGRKLTRVVSNEEMEVYHSESTNGPTIKLIHRFNRHGYKGAALGNAMNYIDPRAEYIAVFDADFVPYPDTIEQFMKSFQEACGGLEKVASSQIAAVQGYQWHVLNKSENWVTRGVRSEYAGSYVVERAGIGIYGGLNQIAGSVFCIRADVLKAFGWQTSITEDLQLTLRLYEQGFKVVFNPYIQAPAEAVSTVRRLIRQRMRWAEGHTFNVKNMWLRMMYSRRISTREKFEFMYLAPYYLQAAFFLIGVTAWFISEVVVHARLPFWTAAWGWSLVFTNFLALPLMNLAGLFLEESEEKDYMGVASFMLLSYIVVPFQAYSAVKALFATEEGPWFRTPKTGLITNDYNRGRFYGWVERLKVLRGSGASGSQLTHSINSLQAVQGGLKLARLSAHNPLSGYKIMPRRRNLVSRGVIAGFLVVVIFMNYSAFFTPIANASFATTPAIEQQLTIAHDISGNGTSDGIICIDTSHYDGSITYTFEIVAKLTSGTGGATLKFNAGTCSSSGTPATPSGGSNAQISTTLTTSYARYSTTFSPTGTQMAYVSAIAGTGISVVNAKVIIKQTHATKLAKTESLVEVGNNDTTTHTTDTEPTWTRNYCYDSTSTGDEQCTAASPSRFTPTPTANFEATLSSNNASGTTTASLYVKGGSQVSGSQISANGTAVQHVRSGAITLTAGTEYIVKINTNNASFTGTVVNTAIVLVQNDATNGVTATETMHYILSTTYGTTTFDTFELALRLDGFLDSNYSGASVVIYYEVNVSNSIGKNSSGKTTVDLLTGTTHSATLTTAVASGPLRQRSTAITPSNADYTSEVKCNACVSGDSAQFISSAFVIQVQNLPVPEIALVALPGMFLLPKIVAWWKRRGQGKVKRGKFGGRAYKRKFVEKFRLLFVLTSNNNFMVKLKLRGFG